MKRLSLFGMNAKQAWFVVVFFIIDLLILGLLVILVIFSWDYTVALLSGIWQFVTVDISRLIFAAVSAFFMTTLGVLWFLFSLGGISGRARSPGSSYPRSYRLHKSRLLFPRRTRSGMRLPAFKLLRMSSHKGVGTSTRLMEIKSPETTSLRSGETSIPLLENKPNEAINSTSAYTSTQLPETEQPKKTDILRRILDWLRLMKIKWPDVDLGSSSGANYYGSTHVRGYFRKDGTYVRSHYRSGYTRRGRRW
jgi:hypothetical protein